MPVPSTAGTSFQIRVPTVLRRGADAALTMESRVAGERVHVSGGTFALTGPTGATLSSGSVGHTGGVASFTVPSSALPDTLAFGEGYREVWTLTTTDGTVIATRPAILARYALACPVTQETLEASLPDLSDLMRGSVDHLQTFIDTAWVDAVNRLLAAGVIPEHVVDVNQLDKPIRCAALAEAFRYFSVANPQVERWPQLAEGYRKESEAAWATFARSRMDADQDGNADNQNRASVGGVMRTNGSVGWPYMTEPRTRSRGGGWRGL